MNTQNGRIYTPDQMEKAYREMLEGSSEMFTPKGFIPMELPPTEKQMARKPPRVGRNDPCPCGSGLKFKKCHLEGG